MCDCDNVTFPFIATSLMIKSRSKSADVSTMRVSRSSQDIKRSIDRLSQPKNREPRDRSVPNRTTSTKPASTPPVKLQPAVPRVVPRENSKGPTPIKDKNKQPTPQKVSSLTTHCYQWLTALCLCKTNAFSLIKIHSI